MNLIPKNNFEKVNICSDINTSDDLDFKLEDHELTTLKCLNEFEKKFGNDSTMSFAFNNSNKMPCVDYNNLILSEADGLELPENEVTVKTEEMKTTDDESMAVEALRQLGGMFETVITQEPEELMCNFCHTKFVSEVDLVNHVIICKSHTYTCNTCKQIFSDQQQFNNHGCQIHETYTCRFCNEKFHNSNKLQSHIYAFHQKDKPYECQICSKHFPRHSSLTNHLKIHSYKPGRALLSGELPEKIKSMTNLKSPENQIFISEPSNNNFIPEPLNQWNINFENSDKNAGHDLSELVPNLNEIVLENNTQISTNNKPHICTHCNLSLTHEKALNSHLKLHLTDWTVVHECEKCSEQFTDLSAKLLHKNTCDIQKPPEKSTKTHPTHKNCKFNCPYCEKKFTTKQKMYRHLWIHRKKTFSCEVCNRSFESQSDLDKHRLCTHTSLTPFSCTDCGKSFASRQGLWEHGRLHSVESSNLYCCKICTKKFSSRQGYLIHNRTHTGERPYGCQYCLKAFKDGGTLRKHERIHTGERPHVCPICLQDFNQKVVLREHVRWVHTAAKIMDENGLFSCQICSLNIADREELCSHIVRHSDKSAAERRSINSNGLVTKKKSQRFAKKKVGAKKLNVANFRTDGNDQSEVMGLQEDSSKMECGLCGCDFVSEDELLNHVRLHV